VRGSADQHSSPTTLTIPALRSGGVMLTYRCTNTCKHCLYRLLFISEHNGTAAGRIGDLHPQITPESHPVFWHLATGGPCALMQWARTHHDYQPQRDAYISKCDLCTDVRRHLHARGGFQEIAPDAFYAN